MQVYFESFKNENDVLVKFGISKQDLKGCEILFACYCDETYEGNAMVILRHPTTKVLYEVNAYHCSCYDLDGQWDMEETMWKAMIIRSSAFFDENVKSVIEYYILKDEVQDMLDGKVESKRKM